MNKSVWLCLLAAAWAITQTVVGQVPSDDWKSIKQAADEGLSQYLSQIPPRELEFCGLPAGLSREKYVIGAPLQLCCILPDTLTNNAVASTTDQLLTSTGEYYVPVIVDGVSRVVLIVGQEAGQWKTVSIGYPVIGRALSEILTDWPENEGYHPKLVAMRQTEEFFFTVPEASKTNLTSVALNRDVGGASVSKPKGARKSITSLQDILPSLKQRVKESRANHVLPQGRGKEMVP